MMKMMERLIDTMKTSAEDVTVLLVGSSAVLVPVDEGDSASAEFAGWRMRLGLVGAVLFFLLTVFVHPPLPASLSHLFVIF